METLNISDTVRSKDFPTIVGKITEIIPPKYRVQYLDKNGAIQTTDFLGDRLELIPDTDEDPIFVLRA